MAGTPLQVRSGETCEAFWSHEGMHRGPEGQLLLYYGEA